MSETFAILISVSVMPVLFLKPAQEAALPPPAGGAAPGGALGLFGLVGAWGAPGAVGVPGVVGPLVTGTPSWLTGACPGRSLPAAATRYLALALATASGSRADPPQ